MNMNLQNYRLQENNQVEIVGTISGKFEFDHEVFGEGFYKNFITVERTSGETDILPIMISDCLIDVSKEYHDQLIKVKGQYRSYNDHSGEKTALILYVFVREIDILQESDQRHVNKAFFNGFICKKPIYRHTPRGREITDVLLAVNRPYGKSDYIPCICWGRCALRVSNMQVGTHIQIEGRIQSREYRKVLGDGIEEERTAYEVSFSRFKEVEYVTD